MQRPRILLDAGVFIAAAQNNRTTFALMESVKGTGLLFLAAHTFAEFYRGGRASASEARLVNMWRPEILTIDAEDGRFAGSLLAVTGGSNSMDALLIASADRNHIDELFTTDVYDLTALRNARPSRSKKLAIVNAQ